MRTIEKTVFKYSELSESAQEKAHYWYTSSWDCFYSDYIIQDAADIAELFGLDIKQTRKTRMDNSHYYAPTVYWSGFFSQGDGACFEGVFSWKKGGLQAVKNYAPNDAELLSIVKSFQQFSAKRFYSVNASVKHSGHYCHERSMSVTNCEDKNGYCDYETEKEFLECCADFACWIYRRLEDEYYYQTSDEVIAENMEANEYEFFENGELA